MIAAMFFSYYIVCLSNELALTNYYILVVNKYLKQQIYDRRLVGIYELDAPIFYIWVCKLYLAGGNHIKISLYSPKKNTTSRFGMADINDQ